MASGLEVHSTELRQYAALIREQAARLEQVHAALAGASVPGGAFGKLPESAGMESAYAQHASAEVTNTAELPGLLTRVAQGLDACAGNYAAAESVNARAARSVSPEAG